MTLAGERFVRVNALARSPPMRALFRARRACTRSPGSAIRGAFFDAARRAGHRCARAIRFRTIIAAFAPDLALTGATRDPDDREGCGKMHRIRRRPLLVLCRSGRASIRRWSSAGREEAPWIPSCLRSWSARSPRARCVYDRERQELISQIGAARLSDPRRHPGDARGRGAQARACRVRVTRDTAPR